MPVPKKRTSTSRSKLRRSHDFFTPVFSVLCPSCGEPVRRHRICLACGTYRGEKLLTIKEKTEAPAEGQQA